MVYWNWNFLFIDRCFLFRQENKMVKKIDLFNEAINTKYDETIQTVFFTFADCFISNSNLRSRSKRFYRFTKRSKSLVREGNELYQQEKYTDACLLPKKALEKQLNTRKQVII